MKFEWCRGREQFAGRALRVPSSVSARYLVVILVLTTLVSLGAVMVADPELYPRSYRSFSGNAQYQGWLSENGGIAGLFSIKADKPKKDEVAVRGTLWWLRSKKTYVKLLPRALGEGVGGSYFGIRLDGWSALGDFVQRPGEWSVAEMHDYDVMGGKDLVRSKDVSERATAYRALRTIGVQGTWTFMLADSHGCRNPFCLTMDGRGKGRLVGTTPRGKTVKVSAQGILGAPDEDGQPTVLACPFMYWKNESFGFVFWKTAGDCMITGFRSLCGQWIECPLQPFQSPPEGKYVLSISPDDVVRVLPTVFPESIPSIPLALRGGRFEKIKASRAKTREMLLVQSNPGGLTLKYNAKSATVTGAFKLYYREGDKMKNETFKISGVFIGTMMYGMASCRKRGAFPVSLAMRTSPSPLVFE